MKQLTIFLFSIISLALTGQVRWLTVQEAAAAQKIKPKKVLIYFFDKNCSPCDEMMSSTFNHPQIAQQLNSAYFNVKFDAKSGENFNVRGRNFENSEKRESNKNRTMHDFAKYMNVNAVPSIVFLDEQLQTITLLQGEITAAELEPYISFIANDDYKKITTREQWQTYQRKFKSTIKR